ncbi:hypothetical protein GWI33_016172 [Rhynchophorus ferrugineus]|uniref:Uncharacterized protein n=1 Tax=Rhynchophorus ferrugineus TaxID=354439 RepID=A0A834M573_RHYFE|nr:hypothetical protein GWI33_016172 [Rhynchophorus ferrugineus]
MLKSPVVIGNKPLLVLQTRLPIKDSASPSKIGRIKGGVGQFTIIDLSGAATAAALRHTCKTDRSDGRRKARANFRTRLRKINAHFRRGSTSPTPRCPSAAYFTVLPKAEIPPMSACRINRWIKSGKLARDESKRSPRPILDACVRERGEEGDC